MATTGRPPNARAGTPLSVGSRFVVAGVGSHARALPPRASAADLWASVEALAVPPQGTVRLKDVHGTSLAAPAQRRFSAYVAQARQYYQACLDVEPVSKPLLGYYFALNLTKAFLTAADPSPTLKGHGASQATKTSTRYRFSQEYTKPHANGIAAELARRTGAGYWYAKRDPVQVSRLIAYLPEAYDLYADAIGSAPKLIPVRHVTVRHDHGAKLAWLTVEMDQEVLAQRSLSSSALLERAAIFGNQFKRVTEPGHETALYESVDPIGYRLRPQVLEPLRAQFRHTLIGRNRAAGGGFRDFLVLSDRAQLVSHEAVTFLVLHHLSNMVRYQPEHVESLRGTRYFWLFSSWVDRACENYLLTMASHLTGEEHVIS